MDNTDKTPENTKPYDVYILIDTNIFFDNYFLKGNKFLALENMIKKTGSKIIMPSIIIGEVKKKYKEFLTDQQEKIDRIGRLCPEMITQNKTVDELVKEYDKFWTDYVKKVELVDSNKVDLRNLIERSLAEQHPFKKESNGFRDAVIWESTLFYLNNKAKQNKHPLVVVTTNKKDFGDGCLFDDLSAELLGRDSYCYSDLGSFLKEHSDRISFITDEYIQEYLEANTADFDYIVEGIEESELIERFRENNWSTSGMGDFSVSDKPVPTGYWEIDSYYIYNEDKENYYIEVELSVEVEYSVRYSKEVFHYYRGQEYPEPDYNYDIEPASGFFFSVMTYKINKETREIEWE